MIIYRNRQGISAIISDAEAKRLTEEGTLVAIDGELVDINSPAIVRLHDGNFAKTESAVKPEDGEGFYLKTALKTVYDSRTPAYYIKPPPGVIAHSGVFYTVKGLEASGLCLLHNGDVRPQSQCYYDHDDKKWYPDDASSKDKYGYHSEQRTVFKTNDKTVFSIGIEVEKNGWPPPKNRISKERIKDKFGWWLEHDGSVSNGFELVSPVYDLFGDQIEKDAKGLEHYLNVKNLDNAGGHMTLSKKGLSSIQLLDEMKNWLPIILSLYRGRLKNGHCRAENIKTIKSNTNRYAIHNKGSGLVEFRIVGAVRSLDNFLWRIKLWRFMCSHLHWTYEEILTSAVEGEFNKILSELNIYKDLTRLRLMLLAATNIFNKYIKESEDKKSFKSITKNINFKADVYSNLEEQGNDNPQESPVEVVGG